MCLDCGSLISYENNRCSKCSNRFRSKQLKTMKVYNHRRDSEVYSFYESTEWSKTREVVKTRDACMCQLCLSDGIGKEAQLEVVKTRDACMCQLCLSDGIGKEAQLVHHIEELKESWERRLDPTNLISLCDSCHKKVHSWYSKSENSKTYMKAKLNAMIPQGHRF